MKEEERIRLEQMWEIEREYRGKGFLTVAGVDEAGRGPLAGPVFAAAVILPEGHLLEGLNDSKKISEKKREALFERICDEALSFSIASASVEEIDRINIREATSLAMNRAIGGLGIAPDLVLVDGNYIGGCPVTHECIIKGDARSASIAAASILAKVSRDRLMQTLAREYPQYQLEKHKGYGTALHIDAIRKYGAAPIHRKTFLKKITGAKQ